MSMTVLTMHREHRSKIFEIRIVYKEEHRCPTKVYRICIDMDKLEMQKKIT